MILCALYVFNDNPLYAHLAKVCLSPEPHLINLRSLLALTKTAKYWPPGPQLPAALHLVSTFVELERLYCYAKFTGWLVSAEKRQVESVILTVFGRMYLRKWDMGLLFRSDQLQRTGNFDLKKFLFTSHAAFWLIQYTQAPLQAFTMPTV